MRLTRSKILCLAMLLNITMYSSAWAGRVLIRDDQQTVSLTQTLDCDEAANITIDTSRPEIYEQDSRQLQIVSDAVRAILAYECPGLNEMNITGLVRGLDEQVYRGKVSERNNWRVQTSAASPQPQPSFRAKDGFESKHRADFMSDLGTPHTFTVTRLQLGMSVDEATRIVSKQFGVTPEYDTGTGLMTVISGGCPENFDFTDGVHRAQVGWKCLRLEFSDQRHPVLQQLELVQVVRAGREAVHRILVDRFGRPVNVSSLPSMGTTQLDWYGTSQALSGDQHAESLNASLLEITPGQVATRLVLSGQAMVESGVAHEIETGLML